MLSLVPVLFVSVCLCQSPLSTVTAPAFSANRAPVTSNFVGHAGREGEGGVSLNAALLQEGLICPIEKPHFFLIRSGSTCLSSTSVNMAPTFVTCDYEDSKQFWFFHGAGSTTKLLLSGSRDVAVGSNGKLTGVKGLNSSKVWQIQRGTPGKVRVVSNVTTSQGQLHRCLSTTGNVELCNMQKNPAEFPVGVRKCNSS